MTIKRKELVTSIEIKVRMTIIAFLHVAVIVPNYLIIYSSVLVYQRSHVLNHKNLTAWNQVIYKAPHGASNLPDLYTIQNRV